MQATDPLVFTTLWAAIAVTVIVIIGSIVQAGLGMGFGLTVAPVLALIDPAMVPAAALYLGTATAVFSAWKERENIVWNEVGIGMAGRSLGIGFGLVLLLSLKDRSTFQLVFGCLIAVAVTLSVFGWQLAMNWRNLTAMGVVSGFTGVVTSVGAPPLALIYQSRPSHLARPTLAAFFSFGGLISLTALYSVGWAGVKDFWLACFMVPGAVFGTWLGRRMKGRFDRRYRPALLTIAGLASVLLIVRGLS